MLQTEIGRQEGADQFLCSTSLVSHCRNIAMTVSQRDRSYGLVIPFVLAVPAFTLPPPMQPSCMFSIFSVK